VSAGPRRSAAARRSAILVRKVGGGVWRDRVWRPDRERFRRWLCRDVARRADGQPVAMAVEGCTGWHYVVEEITAAGFEAHLAEPADTHAALVDRESASDSAITAIRVSRG
jgi:hypothetical protein